MIVGDRIQVNPCQEGGGRGPVEAAVVYIHPKRRYFVAEYRAREGGAVIRECFPIRYRQGAANPKGAF